MDLAKLDPPLPADPAARPFEAIGSLQMRVMHFIWASGAPATVTEVHDALNKTSDRHLAYTTFLTVMRNLARRGILEQTKLQARSHYFRALITRVEYEDQTIRYLVETMFGGKYAPLLSAIERNRPE